MNDNYKNFNCCLGTITDFPEDYGNTFRPSSLVESLGKSVLLGFSDTASAGCYLSSSLSYQMGLDWILGGGKQMNCEGCIWKQSERNGIVTCKIFELTARGLVDVAFYERPANGCCNKRVPKGEDGRDPIRTRKKKSFSFGRQKI